MEEQEQNGVIAPKITAKKYAIKRDLPSSHERIFSGLSQERKKPIIKTNTKTKKSILVVSSIKK